MKNSRYIARGFTVLDVVVWVGIFTFVLGAIIASILYFYKTNNYAIEQGSATVAAQRGIDMLVKTAREAAYASNGAYPIVSMSTSSLTFYADVDSDPLIEQVHYYVSGNSLVQGVIDATGDPPVYTSTEATSTLAEYVHNTDQGVDLFAYYDSAGAQITDLTKVADLRFVVVNLVVDVNPLRSPTLLTLRSAAALRNLK